jgi:bacteriocin biosynthesis cyclodehydratase domain-containing protein
MRPLLEPGLHVLRRADGHVQVGLGRDRAVVLPETESVRRTLHLLSRGELPADDVPAPLRAVLRRRPDRPSGTVCVVGFGHPSGQPMLARIRTLLTDAGLGRGRVTADAAVVAGVGEPSREVVDVLVQRGTPHLLVRLVEGDVLLGPFVVPGVTACLRCVDAFATDEDPSWPLLVEQYAGSSARDRCDGATEPVDPLLAEIAGAWAARDIATYLSGHRPATWSATVRLDPMLRDLRRTDWLRHPECGCTWSVA